MIWGRSGRGLAVSSPAPPPGYRILSGALYLVGHYRRGYYAAAPSEGLLGFLLQRGRINAHLDVVTQAGEEGAELLRPGDSAKFRLDVLFPGRINRPRHHLADAIDGVS